MTEPSAIERFEWTDFVAARGHERVVAVGLERDGHEVGELVLDTERATALAMSILDLVDDVPAGPFRPDRQAHDPRWGINPAPGCGLHRHETCADTWCTCGCHRGEPETPDDHPGWLHAELAHPDWEYETTEGQRKAFYDQEVPPEGEGWERNVDHGRGGWNRFDYTEEAYWRRPRPTTGAS